MLRFRSERGKEIGTSYKGNSRGSEDRTLEMYKARSDGESLFKPMLKTVDALFRSSPFKSTTKDEWSNLPLTLGPVERFRSNDDEE